MEAHGSLLRLTRKNGAPAQLLRRIPLGASSDSGGVDESFLQDLLYRYPQTLPIAAIDAAYADPVPICRELSTRAGRVDALYVNALGRLTLAEFKLWRNPQARREVIGQILDYTKELASWRYEDLQREVSKALGTDGNTLYELVSKHEPGLNEADFVDNVTRHLKRGEFLLLIIGDGIREGVENIVDFVQRYTGLHFNLALVEAALYRDGTDHLVVQPRVLARTEIVHRIVIDEATGRRVGPDPDPDPLPYEEQNLQFWTRMLEGYAFKAVDVEVPAPSKESTIYLKVPNSGFGDWGLSFGAYLYRKSPTIGCYVTCRKDIPSAVRVYKELETLFEEFRQEIGSDLIRWGNSAGRPRIGFRRNTGLAFLAASEDPASLDDAVAWMREHLDRLVTGLYPRLQHMLSGRS
ncbi:MAG: hypothetical protein F4Y45_15100 [Acidobacteria bacterium]|nr:hypothetical protein [Acidobacteriota bacterium]MYJ02769.1 hypothetical protein [Acidobacteriota bacterium]